MLLIKSIVYAECRTFYAEYRYAEYCYAECRDDKCQDTQHDGLNCARSITINCHYADGRIFIVVLNVVALA
jgi:hypothetical protein